MKNIILIAPPAAGKGTQSDLLVSKYNYTHISTGNLLRSLIAENTELSKEIESIISTGNLVSDDIVTKLLEEKLKTTKGPFVFDGYPRNIEQALILERILTKLNIELGIAIYLDLDKEEAIKRATGRIMCSNCGKIYNLNFDRFKPKKDGICDNCMTQLIVRDDDTKEAYAIRYEIYKTNIMPLLNHYEDRKILNEIKVSPYPEGVFNKIEKIIL